MKNTEVANKIFSYYEGDIETVIKKIATHNNQNELIDYLDDMQVAQQFENTFTCKEFLEFIEEKVIENVITIDDVIQVARELNFNPTLQQIDEVIRIYPYEQKADSTATWNLIVEHCLYSLNVEQININ